MSAQGQNEKTIAFVLYPGLTPFDLVGPLQVITQLARAHPEIRPVVVGERIKPMATDIGAEMIPERTFERYRIHTRSSYRAARGPRSRR
jgi:hypothetical protein